MVNATECVTVIMRRECTLGQKSHLFRGKNTLHPPRGGGRGCCHHCCCHQSCQEGWEVPCESACGEGQGSQRGKGWGFLLQPACTCTCICICIQVSHPHLTNYYLLSCCSLYLYTGSLEERGRNQSGHDSLKEWHYMWLGGGKRLAWRLREDGLAMSVIDHACTHVCTHVYLLERTHVYLRLVYLPCTCAPL